MHLRTCLILSAGLNVALGTGWYIASRPVPPSANVIKAGDSTNGQVRTKTSVFVRTQSLTWQDVESADYITFIRNLRTIGCPEQTIRDIIVADVNQLYAHRRATEIVSGDNQWWRSDPDNNLVKAALEKIKELDAERKALLTKLLGPGWDSDLNALAPSLRTLISLTGPVLGELPPATKKTVYDIAVRMQDKIDVYQETQRQQNKPIDPMELAKLREAARGELAAVLKPEQMEEFLLRYSQTAQDMREELRGLNPSQDEFRALFRARDEIDSQVALYYTGDDPQAIKRRQELEEKRDAATRKALGEERYAEYQLNQDPVFRQSKTIAENFGVPADAVMPMYEVNRLTEAELDRIRSDDSLSSEEKVESMAAARVEQQKSLEKLMGEEAFEKWLLQQK